MTEPAALLEKRGHVGLITLNRPSALNAVNASLATAVGEALADCTADPHIRAIVITGAGRAFCAGADLKEIAAGNSIEAQDHPEWGFAGLIQHWVPKPVIAAVNGFALGGGTEIVLACDLAVIDETAKLGLPEASRGLYAAGGGVIRLPRQVPMKIALEMALTGEPIDAAAAQAWGLVNRVAPQGEAVATAIALAETIAANAPLAVRTSKAVVHRSLAMGSDWEDDVWKLNEEAISTVFGAPDAIEGTRAFAEKRLPRWQDS